MDLDASVDAICTAFPRIFERFHRRIPAGGYRPSLESLAVLRHLHRAGPLTVREAQDHFARSQASTSEIFARLEERGLLTRLRDERDRRRTLVWLSEAGQAALREADRVLDPELLRSALTRQPKDTVRAIVHGVRRLAEVPVAGPAPGVLPNTDTEE